MFLCVCFCVFFLTAINPEQRNKTRSNESCSLHGIQKGDSIFPHCYDSKQTNKCSLRTMFQTSRLRIPQEDPSEFVVTLCSCCCCCCFVLFLLMLLFCFVLVDVVVFIVGYCWFRVFLSVSLFLLCCCCCCCCCFGCLYVYFVLMLLLLNVDAVGMLLGERNHISTEFSCHSTKQETRFQIHIANFIVVSPT